MSIRCPECRRHLELPSDLPAGEAVRCPWCGHSLAVPRSARPRAPRPTSARSPVRRDPSRAILVASLGLNGVLAVVLVVLLLGGEERGNGLTEEFFRAFALEEEQPEQASAAYREIIGNVTLASADDTALGVVSAAKERVLALSARLANEAASEKWTHWAETTIAEADGLAEKDPAAALMLFRRIIDTYDADVHRTPGAGRARNGAEKGVQRLEPLVGKNRDIEDWLTRSREEIAGFGGLAPEEALDRGRGLLESFLPQWKSDDRAREARDSLGDTLARLREEVAARHEKCRVWYENATREWDAAAAVLDSNPPDALRAIRRILDSYDPSLPHIDEARTIGEKARQRANELVKKTTGLEEGELTPTEVFARCSGSVAIVATNDGSGSGFLLGKHLVVTNAHVTARALTEEFEVRFPSAGPEKYRVNRVLLEDYARDITILEVACDLKPLEVVQGDSFHAGREILVIGSPGVGGQLTLENALTSGLLSTKVEIGGVAYYQLSTSINPGNSGGPVLDHRGRVLAMTSLRAVYEEGIAFGVPAEALRKARWNAEILSPDAQVAADDLHCARVILLRLDEGTSALMFVLDLVAEGIQTAVRLGVRAEESVQLTRDLAKARLEEVEGWVLENRIEPRIQGLMKRKAGGKDYAALAELLKVYRQARDHLKQPLAHARTFAGSVADLKKAHDRYRKQAADELEIRLRERE